MEALAILWLGLLGAAVGSFLNVVAHRLPRGESLVSPRSRCPSCGNEIAARDNVPVVSWLLLRGRCRSCGEPISSRYPLVELLTALVFAAVALVRGVDVDLVYELPFAAMLIAVASIDLDHRIIPNRIVLPAAIFGLLAAVVLRTDDLAQLLIAGAAAFVALFLAALAYPAGMGMGDVKLAGVMGLFLGRAIGPAMLIALLAGSLLGMAIIAKKGRAEGRKTAIPFGPFLAFGGLVGLFAGDEIVDWYLDTFAS